MTDIRARTVKGFCEAYGVGMTKTYELIGAGKLKAVKVGTRTLIMEDSAREWFENLPASEPKSKPKYLRSPEHAVWANMIQRCTNPRREDFKWYGARGIKVCERWRSFDNFYADMGPRPAPNFSIDRINNDGNYEPCNCRWTTSQKQRNNRRPREVLPITLPITESRVGGKASERLRIVKGRESKQNQTGNE